MKENHGRRERTIIGTAEIIRREAEAKGFAIGFVKGFAIGFARGLARAEARGLTLGHVSILTRLLQKRFGPLPDQATQRIETASLADLDRWVDRTLDAPNLDAVFAAD